MKHYGYVDDKGKLSPVLKDYFASDLDNYRGRNITIEIRENKGKRTLPQNNFLHLLLTIFKDELNAKGNNFDLESVKDLVKFRFLREDVVDESTGEVLGQRLGHTSKLDKQEFNELIEKLKAWAAEMDIILPDPEQQFEML